MRGIIVLYLQGIICCTEAHLWANDVDFIVARDAKRNNLRWLLIIRVMKVLGLASTHKAALTLRRGYIGLFHRFLGHPAPS